MNLERDCSCGAMYLATGPYDYCCPGCWEAECVAAVRVVEWIGGCAPPGAVAIEHTPLTDTWDAARSFLCDRVPDLFYGAFRGGDRPTFLACMVSQYRQPWTLRLHDSLLADELDWHATHDRPILDQARGWWWLDTELAWIADPTEITCTETECCLAQNDA